MPPSLGNTREISRAIQTQAIPALTVYEENPDYLESSRKRSLGSEESEDNCPESQRPSDSTKWDTTCRLTFATIRALSKQQLEQVLADDAAKCFKYRNTMSQQVTVEDVFEYCESESGYVGRPAYRLRTEVDLELSRIKLASADETICSEETKVRLQAMDVHQKSVLARYFVRRRWKSMGLWDASWIQKSTPNRNWTWPWQDYREEDEYGNLKLTRDAIRSCGGMGRGEHGKFATKASRLNWPRPDWSIQRGDGFIRARPWFVFDVECMVEHARRERQKLEDSRGNISKRSLGQTLSIGAADWVRLQWEKQGIWNEEWNLLAEQRDEPIVGWTWKGEGPEPDWADLGELNSMDELGLTPSEAERVRIHEQGDGEQDNVPGAVPRAPLAELPQQTTGKLAASPEASVSGEEEGNLETDQNKENIRPVATLALSPEEMEEAAAAREAAPPEASSTDEETDDDEAEEGERNVAPSNEQLASVEHAETHAVAFTGSTMQEERVDAATLRRAAQAAINAAGSAANEETTAAIPADGGKIKDENAGVKKENDKEEPQRNKKQAKAESPPPPEEGLRRSSRIKKLQQIKAEEEIMQQATLKLQDVQPKPKKQRQATPRARTQTPQARGGVNKAPTKKEGKATVKGKERAKSKEPTAARERRAKSKEPATMARGRAKSTEPAKAKQPARSKEPPKGSGRAATNEKRKRASNEVEESAMATEKNKATAKRRRRG